MSACPCGCGHPVKPGKRCASAGCGGRLRKDDPAYRAHLSKAGKRRWASMSPAQQRAALVHMSGRAKIENWERNLDRWLEAWARGDDPRALITQIYRRGYGASRSQIERLKQRIAALEHAVRERAA